MSDPRRELYKRWGLWRYGWWLLWVNAAELFMVRGSYSGVRFRLAVSCLWLSRVFRP